MISEIRMATVCVRNLDAARAYYAKVFDYVGHGEADVIGGAYESLWQMPSGLTGRSTVLGPAGAETGFLRLVAFDTPGEPIWGDYSSPQNYGHYALNMRVPEIRAAIDRIHENGGSTRSEPNYWTVSDEVSAWDSMSYDPDGVILDVFELVTSPDSLLADYDGKCSGLQTVALHASDARATARFYAALGFRPWYDKLLENMEDFFHLPKGTALHNINLVMPDATIGRIEVAQYVGWEGESLRHMAVPPNIGILSISLETDDLDATDALLTTIGAERCSDSVEVSLEPFGLARASSWFGPDGELLELFQRL